MQKSVRNHQVERLAKKITTASSPQKKRGAIRAYLSSFAAKCAAVEEACRKKKIAFSKTAMQSIAQNIDVWEPCSEKVKLHPKLKDGTTADFRWLLSFGVENSARQILVRSALAASGGIAPEQTIFQGGRDEAIRRVKKNYEAGYNYTSEIDVYRCFESFDRLKVGNYLGLPERVVTNVLSGVSLNISVSKPHRDKVLAYTPDDAPMTPIELMGVMDEEWEPARQGLSEGSMVSPLAAELLLAWIVKNVTNGAWRIVVYADNFLCQCQDEDAAYALDNELRKLLHQHPAGPLKAKNALSLIKPGEVFDFLGYALAPETDGVLIPHPNDNAHRKLKALRREAYKVLNAPNAPFDQKIKILQSTLKRQRQIVRGYIAWEDAEAYLTLKEAKLRTLADLHGLLVQKKPKTALKLPKQQKATDVTF